MTGRNDATANSLNITMFGFIALTISALYLLLVTVEAAGIYVMLSKTSDYHYSAGRHYVALGIVVPVAWILFLVPAKALVSRRDRSSGRRLRGSLLLSALSLAVVLALFVCGYVRIDRW